jgi:two-component system LytT family response regulator
MTATQLRVVIADDERPSRAFLAGMLRSAPDVALLGEASSGPEAVTLIEQLRPDLALLDLQMPEVDGLGVVRLIKKELMPLIAFVTAYDEYAVRAFELNAIDYLLKPVEPARLRQTLMRAHERLERADYKAPAETDRLRAAMMMYDAGGGGLTTYLRRIPVRKREDIMILAVEQIASIVADGELLRITTLANDRHTITYRLKDLEARLDPAQFVRLSRGAIVNLDVVQRVSPMPGGTYVAILANRQQIGVSRLRARALREHLFRL